MAKNITHGAWIQALLNLYTQRTGRMGNEYDPGFERWLEKVPVEELEDLLAKLEN